VVDAGGAPLADAVVAAYSAAAAAADPRAEAVMDQQGKQFRPHVLAVRVGTLVHFPNSDQIRHHVYSFSPARPFELKLYEGLEAPPVRFARPGKVVLGCNIHDQMLGYVYVLETPWFAVTDAAGDATLKAPSGGAFDVHVLHPRLADETRVSTRVTAPHAGLLTLRMPESLAPASVPAAPAEDPLQDLFRRRR
jgi:plastocyanin